MDADHCVQSRACRGEYVDASEIYKTVPGFKEEQVRIWVCNCMSGFAQSIENESLYL